MNKSLNELKSFYKTPKAQQSLFISLEGIEGSGKSTQIKNLQDFFSSKNYQVLTLREPGGTLFGEKLREAILESKTPLHPMAEAHLFLSSRAQILHEKIIPFLATPNSVVILDRFIDSTLAYQGNARGLGYELVLDLHRHGILSTIPHRTYLLDITLETSFERQDKRGNAKDYFESEKANFYQKLIQGYHDMHALFPERILKIDASSAPDAVRDIIYKDLSEKFSL